MINGVAGVGGNAQDAMTHPTPRASKAMVAGFCAMGCLLSALPSTPKARNTFFI
jgi:hypothetical protein